jgi:hypothetical protein
MTPDGWTGSATVRSSEVAPLHFVDGDPHAAAIAAANALWDDPDADVGYEPDSVGAAQAAVAALAACFAGAGGTVTQLLDNARAAAQILSRDRLQGLAEIVQNADDAQARMVRFLLDGNTLLVAHDGRPVILRDILALATPWLTTKRNDSTATGRFGIGLMTLHALADSFEVHSGHYHVRFGEENLSAVNAPDLPAEFAEPRSTVLRVPLPTGRLEASELVAWASRWDDSALLFCAHVNRVTFTAGTETRTLGLEWDERDSTNIEVGGTRLSVRQRVATASDGRSWIVRTTDAPSPAGLARAHKATRPTTPLAVALSVVGGETGGELYAGLPVIATRLPLRANAQFDPLAGRQELADTDWNLALAELVADLWTGATLDLFAVEPIAAWDALPLPGSKDINTTMGIAAHLEALLLDRSRAIVAERLTFVVDGAPIAIADLAVEVPQLDGLLTPAEVAAMADLPAALPVNVRDTSGRWRAVLDDWRANGASLSDPVTVDDALPLVADDSRPPSATVALAAAAIAEGLSDRLATLACVVDTKGVHLRPPAADSPWVVVDAESGLAKTLGMAVEIHDAYLGGTNDALAVLAWLRSRGAFVSGADPRAVLARLAAAGDAGHGLTEPLTDDQLRALRDAFEPLGQADWSAFGPGVGRSILLDAFRFDRGRRVAVRARPADSYLPKTIDREPDSFAVAADTTPGITWLASRYAGILRSSLGRIGLGPQRFLHLLGAETVPRTVPHANLEPKYAYERSLGLAADTPGSPRARSRSLRDIGADYTLDDRESPDLQAVLQDIARDRKATRRRQRAAAVLATLGRAWGSLGEVAEVGAVLGYHSWRHKGTVRAWWLWQAATIPWLDDASASPMAPIALRLRTPGTVAVHGLTADGYLHPFFASPRRDVLAALGVTGEPSTGDLVARLRQLRDHPPADAEVAAETAVVYQALAKRLSGRARLLGDLSLARLRQAFGDGDGLVRSSRGWQPTAQVLAGPPVFGGLRSFVPQVPGTDRLWSALDVRRPGIDDCLDVLGELARTRSAPNLDTQTVILDTLRLLGQLLSSGRPTPTQTRRLSKLMLWTTLGWTSSRPIYTVDDPELAAALGTEVAVWQPGGELAQFRDLLRPLHLTDIPATACTVVEAVDAEVDEESTALLAEAVRLLREDLARNDPATESSLCIDWDQLAAFEVRVAPNLRARVEGIEGSPTVVAVTAIADRNAAILFLVSPDILARVDGGGRAVAGLFSTDRRRLAQAWLAAVDLTRSGREAVRLELASHRAAAEEADNQAAIAARLAVIQAQSKKRRRTGAYENITTHPVGTRTSGAGASGKGAIRRREDEPSASSYGSGGAEDPSQRSPLPPRVLVDPDILRVVDPEGKIVAPAPGQRGSRGRKNRSSRLPEPRLGGAAPQSHTSPRNYTDLEKETLGLRLARMVLASDAENMIDLRAQHGVGADAVDELRQFYELKVSAGVEPDRITLEDAEIRRAMSTPDFFLVVVSGVEGAKATPRVRVIVDPRTQLRMVETSAIRYEGVRQSHSLVYDLSPEPESTPLD